MSVTTLIEFDDASEHSFDIAKLELADDKGQLKSQVSANEILFSNFDGNILPTLPTLSKRGAKTIVFSGVDNTATIAGGLLTFLEDRSIATYSNITDIVDDFAFRCRVQAIVTTVTQDRDLVSIKSNVDQSEIRFFFKNDGGGITRIHIEVLDFNGDEAFGELLGLKDMAIDPNWNIAISNDDSGNILTFLDGVLVDTSPSPTMDFTDLDIVFGDGTLDKSAASFDNVQLFKANEITANFAFPFPEATTFDLNEHVMLTQIPFVLDEIVSFTVIEQILADSQLKHFICLDLRPIYFDGAAWVNSDQTLAKSNTAAEINSNLATLPLVKGIQTSLQIGHIFNSDLGYATAVIESVSIKYKFSFKGDDVTTCLVFGTIIDNANKPIEGATVRVDSDDKFFSGAFVGPTAKVVTDAQGKFSISLVETATDNTAVNITIEYTQKIFDDEKGVEVDDLIVFQYKNRIIPNTATAKLSDLLVLAS